MLYILKISTLVILKRLTPESKEIFGPITKNFKNNINIIIFPGLI